MHTLPTDWSALCALVFLLGMRHGFDADHLATIDGLTRLNTLQRKPFARYCGMLFSLGHGAVVMAIAAGVGLASERWEAPAWLDAFGAWLSITFLLTIALVNLRAVLATEAQTDPAQAHRYTGEVVGAPCFREHKPEHVAAWLQPQGLTLADCARTWFYSDSINDLPLLEAVTDPVVVTPDARLRAEAEQRGWPIRMRD